MQDIEYLVRRGLMHAGLVELTPMLTARYNECLVSMGIPPTKREVVHVDGIGWSPEVAEEQKNPFYLCNGIINPNAIIVHPDQNQKPIHFSRFSWEREMMRRFFDQYYREILDITATHVVLLEFENGLSSLVGPEDLLLLSKIVVEPDTDGLAEAAGKQQELITHFMDELYCLETDVREAIVASREQHGDLRKKHLAIAPLEFDSFNDFFTIAFDGVAVIRGVGETDLLVLDSQDIYESIKGKERAKGATVCYLYDPHDTPFRLLREAGMIELPLKSFRKDPSILERKRDLLLALSLCDCEKELDWEDISIARRKALMRKHEKQVPVIFGELERLIAALQRGAGSIPELSNELWYYLAAPAERYPSGTKEVLWILLTRKEPRNVLESYTYDKNHFLTQYHAWSDQKQKWVADYLAVHYVSRMSLL